MTEMTSPIHIVLVNSLYSRNIGSVARVMANMGAQRLILIAPQCEIDVQARQGAAGAQTHLAEHTQYNTWEDFLSCETTGTMVAFCARGKKDMDPIPVEERVESFRNNPNIENKPLYFIFGPEDHGLENVDLEYVNYICTLPIYGNFKSYNLSHAVLLALYISKKTLAQGKIIENMNSSESTSAGSESFYFPSESIKTWLSKLGFKIGDRRSDVYKVLKRILLRNLATPKELRILEAIVNQTVRKLPDTGDAEYEES